MPEAILSERPQRRRESAERPAREYGEEAEHRRTGHTSGRSTERAHEPVHRRPEAVAEARDVLACRERRMCAAERLEETKEGPEEAEHHEEPDKIRRQRERE